MRSVNDKMVDCIEIKAFYAIININAVVVESAVCNPTKKDPWFIKTPITPRKKTASKSDLFTRLKYFLYEDNPIKKSRLGHV